MKKNLFIWGLAISFALSGICGCNKERKYETISALEGAVSEADTAVSEVPAEQQVSEIRIESETEAPPAEPEVREPVSLLFGGDIYLSEHVLGAYNRAGGISGVLEEGLREEIAEADLFIANQEFPFSDRGVQAADKQFTFRLPTDKVYMMQEIGADLVTLANNHALDYGTDALLDTCMVLDEAGILRIGAGANLEEAGRMEVVELDGKKFGFLGASRVFPVADWEAGSNHPGMLSAYDSDTLCEVIREAKTRCDYLIVYVHWGIERNTKPENYQRAQGKQYIDAGADLVVGSHPHVLQGIEYYNGKPILYSLGNFIFGSSIPETMLVKAEIAEDGATVLSLLPATSSGGYTRTLEIEKWAPFFRKMEGLSEEIQISEEGIVSPAGKME